MSDHLNRPPLIDLISRLRFLDAPSSRILLLETEEVVDAITDLLEDDEKLYKTFLEELMSIVGQTLRNQLNRLVRSRLGQENRDLAERLLPGISKLEISRTETGQFIETLDNVAILAEHIAEGKLCWDTFTHRLYFKSLPTWMKWKKPPTPGALGWTLFDDVYYTTIARIISKPYIMPKFKSIDTLKYCLREISRTQYTFDYYQEIMNSLPVWDGVNRLDYWAETYLHAVCNSDDERKLVRAYCRRFIISMMYRCYKAPCLIRGTILLESEQQKGKSWFVSVLGSPFAMELNGRSMNLQGAGGTANDIQGKIVVEIAEFDALSRKADAATMKEFTTRQKDTYTPKYISEPIDHPRRSVIIGSINPNPSGYLTDTTGNTRFWPIKCGEGKFDVSGFERDKDQILAEARVAFMEDEDRLRNGEKFLPSCFLSPEEEMLHDVYVADREIENDAMDIVMQFLNDNRSSVELCGMQISNLQDYWKGRPPSNKNISDALEKLGLKHFRAYVGKIQKRFWIYPGTEEIVKKNVKLEIDGGNVVPFKKPDF